MYIELVLFGFTVTYDPFDISLLQPLIKANLF